MYGSTHNADQCQQSMPLHLNLDNTCAGQHGEQHKPVAENTQRNDQTRQVH